MVDDNGHIWHERVFASMQIRCCMNCGFIKNEDKPNKPCPGPIGVSLREPALGHVPALGKLFDDMAAKQRLIGEEFEKFMTDVEDTTEEDGEGAIRKLKEKP